MAAPSLDPCLALLRQADPDRYAATLYLPESKRSDVAALFAFGAEIETIVERASEPMPGEIRLQWWREVIDGEREHGDHPVAIALMDTISRQKLPVAPLMALIEAHVFELYNDPMPDLEALEAWCGQTSSVLLQLSAIAIGAGQGRAVADACGHGGVALSLAKLVRRAGFDRRKGRVFPPQVMLAAAGLDARSWLAEPAGERHSRVVSALCALAREHRAKALIALAKAEPGLQPLFLPLATVGAFLAAGEGAQLAIFERPAMISPLRRQWLIAKAALMGLR